MTKKKKGNQHPRQPTSYSLRDAKEAFGLTVKRPSKDDPFAVKVSQPSGVADGRYCMHRRPLEGGATEKEKGYEFSINNVPVMGGNGPEQRIEIVLPNSWFKRFLLT